MLCSISKPISCLALAGINFLDLMLKIKNNIKYKVPKIKEITVLRYYNEITL